MMFDVHHNKKYYEILSANMWTKVKNQGPFRNSTIQEHFGNFDH